MFQKARIYELFLIHKYRKKDKRLQIFVYAIIVIKETITMLKKQFDNNSFALYSPDSLQYITNDLEIILNESLELYKKIFDVDKFRKVQINYFDNIEDFRNYIYELRGEKESLPEYAKGTFDNGMINALIQPNIIEGTPSFIHRKYSASHELFHIMYQELILKKNNQNRIIWFDEGMAQFFSGEKNKEMTLDFSNWLSMTKSNTKKIPNLNNLNHCSDFETKDYDGYNLSLLAIKYLYDKLGIDELKKCSLTII